MKTVAGHRLQDAARMLNVGPRTLIQELRARGILDQHNLPYRHHVESGDFTISQRQHTLRGYHITRYYALTLVTGKGMTLLATIAQDIINGTRKATTPVRSRNHDATNQRATEGSAVTGANSPAGTHSHACAAGF